MTKWWCCCNGVNYLKKILNISNTSHTKSSNCFLFCPAVAFAQSTVVSCWVENDDVIGAVPSGNFPATSELIFRFNWYPAICNITLSLSLRWNGRFQWNFRWKNFNIILVITGWGISGEIAWRWFSLDLTSDESTLVQVMAWCHQATSHYLIQCWPSSMSYGVTGPEWFEATSLAIFDASIEGEAVNLSISKLQDPCKPHNKKNDMEWGQNNNLYSYSWWHHDMEMLFTSLALCEGIPWWFYIHYHIQALILIILLKKPSSCQWSDTDEHPCELTVNVSSKLDPCWISWYCCLLSLHTGFPQLPEKWFCEWKTKQQ